MTQELRNHLETAVVDYDDKHPVDIIVAPPSTPTFYTRPDTLFRTLHGHLTNDNTAECVVVSSSDMGTTGRHIAIGEVVDTSSAEAHVRIGVAQLPPEHSPSLPLVLQAIMEKLEIDGLVPGGLGRGGTHITIEGDSAQAAQLERAAASLAVGGWVDSQIGNTDSMHLVTSPIPIERFVTSHSPSGELSMTA